MRPAVRYRGRSGVDVDVDRARIGFAANALRTEGYLTGVVVDVVPLRAALGALAVVVRAGLPEEAPADAWITVADDAVFLEGGDDDGGRWLRVRLDRAALRSVRDAVPGTTTAPVPAALGRGLARLGPRRATTLAIAPGGVDGEVDGTTVLERLDDDGPAGMRSRTAASVTFGAQTTTLAPAALVRALRDGGGAGLPVDGPDAARVLAGLLPSARTVVVDHRARRALRWRVDCASVQVTLTLADADAASDAAPDAVEDAALVARAAAALSASPTVRAEALAAATGALVPAAWAALAAVAARGAAFCDVDGAFRSRALHAPVPRQPPRPS